MAPTTRAAPSAVPRPFLKWAGGKTRLLPQLAALYPPGDLWRYVEPFVGSAAVFFHVRSCLEPRRILLADDNPELIGVYAAVRDDVASVIRLLEGHRRKHSSDHYYAVRGQVPSKLEAAARAARMIYLNRTCFNGLYRLNSRGAFNVPMGRYEHPTILDAENLRAVSLALKGVALKRAHFRATLRYARAGDFIYFDPPYQPLSKTSSFTSYTAGAFGEEDQEELAAVYAELAGRGCFLMLSNSESPLVRRLYRAFDIRRVTAARAINSRADRRGAIDEVVVINYEPSPRPFARVRERARGPAPLPFP